MSGSSTLFSTMASARTAYHLNRSYYGLYVSSMMWREIDNFSSGSVHGPGLRVLRRGRLLPRPRGIQVCGKSVQMSFAFYDLTAQHALSRPNWKQAVARVLERNDFILGSEVEAFEDEFARFCGARGTVSAAPTDSTPCS